MFLRQAQDKLTLRRTVQVRLGFDLGFRISDLGFLTTIDDIELNSSDFAICSLALTSFSANFQSAFRNPHSAIVDPVARPPRLARMAGRHAHLRGLARAIHEISGLRI
jgi:hypothetical protein